MQSDARQHAIWHASGVADATDTLTAAPSSAWKAMYAKSDDAQKAVPVGV